MVRTKAGSVSTKAVGAKAPQKVAITAILSGNASKGRNSGGNSYHPRETPGWQKPITFFMEGGESSKDVSKKKREKEEEPKILETDVKNEPAEEELEVKKKKIKVDKSNELKQQKEKNNEDEMSNSTEEEEEEEGIPGIASTDSSKKMTVEYHNDMEIEETGDAEIIKKKEIKEDSKEMKKIGKANKYEGEDKENELTKDDTKNTENLESEADEGENKEN